MERTNANLFERLHLVDGVGHIIQHNALGQLQLEKRRIYAGLIDYLTTCATKSRLTELAYADVDCHLQVAR